MSRTSLPPRLHVGTSSFSAKDWVGPFYPPGTQPAAFLSHYATVYDTVEIDATWHAWPSHRTVAGWARKAPPGFVYSLKVPKTITHERYLEDCAEAWDRFWTLLEPLGEARGPLLFQFPYVAKGRDAHEYETGEDFLYRLERFLPLLSREGRYVVEVRNAKWYRAPLYDLLRRHGVTLALIAYYTLPAPARLFAGADPVTGPFGYLRFLGHHRQMDKLVRAAREERGKTTDWDELLVDRTAELRGWITFARGLLDRWSDTYAYFNNHYAGYAPGSIELFTRLWKETP